MQSRTENPFNLEWLELKGSIVIEAATAGKVGLSRRERTGH